MKLLGIPEEVIEGCILPFLGWNDLLRFRRACKETHRITTRHMRVHPELAPEIEISEEDEDKSCGAFLRMDIPTTKLFLNNVSGDEFYIYGGPDMGDFLKKYGELVTSLRVKKLSLYPHRNEFAFINSLKNLRHFEAGCFAVGKELQNKGLVKRNTDGLLKDPCTSGGIHLPEQFQELESIKVGQDLVVENILTRSFLLPKHMEAQLKYVSLPFNPYINKDLLLQPSTPTRYPLEPEFSLLYAFSAFMCHINSRKEMYPDKANLKAIDFASYYDMPGQLMLNAVENSTYFFIDLCQLCLENKVKMHNVLSRWFYARLVNPNAVSQEQLEPIVSMVNLHPTMLSLEMPNLERLKIRKTSECELPAKTNWRQERPEWVSLKSLDVNVDFANPLTLTVNQMVAFMGFGMFRTRDIFNFCFNGIHRPALTELRLNFMLDNLPLPKTDDIVDSCPNLKKLTLVNWLGTNKALLTLWEGLRGLEEVSLEQCRNLGNVAFVGVDAKNPVFFKLKNLKKLSLKGLDKMPKITDTLFSLVMRHLPLSHFIITSEEPIKSVTSTGIRSLLEGQFATSIEKFPFKDWSLDGVFMEDFQNLETQFRSYEMI